VWGKYRSANGCRSLISKLAPLLGYGTGTKPYLGTGSIGLVPIVFIIDDVMSANTMFKLTLTIKELVKLKKPEQMRIWH